MNIFLRLFGLLLPVAVRAESGPPDLPGGALATALVFRVAWAYHLLTLVRQRNVALAPGRPAPAVR